MRWPWRRRAIAAADPVAAQRQLAELLARPETLLPVERLLAMVQLKEVEQTLILQAENTRMRDDVPQTTRMTSCRRSIVAWPPKPTKMRSCARPWMRLGLNSRR